MSERTGVLRVRPQDKWSWQRFLFSEVRFAMVGPRDAEPWFFPGTSPGEQGTVRLVNKDVDQDGLRQQFGISADRRTRITGLRVDPTLYNRTAGFAVLE